MVTQNGGNCCGCAQALLDLKESLPQSKQYLFYGYHTGKIHTSRMSPRSIQLLFRVWAKRSGEKVLKPKLLRHLYIMDRFRAGAQKTEIMDELGLRTQYLFALYQPLLETDLSIPSNLKAKPEFESPLAGQPNHNEYHRQSPMGSG